MMPRPAKCMESILEVDVNGLHALAPGMWACLSLIGTLGKFVGLIGYDQSSALEKTWYLDYGLYGWGYAFPLPTYKGR